MRHLLWLGAMHIFFLFIVGYRLPVPQDNLAVQTLHKAGFLHTLMGLGAAVVAVAQAWGKTTGTVTTAAPVLIPMATALIPHILGVWFGHSIEMKHSGGASMEDLRRKTEETMQATMRLLNDLQEKVKRFNTTMDGAINGCAGATRRVEHALENLTNATQKTSRSAEEMRKSIMEVTEVSSQLITVHRQVVSLLSSPLFRMNGKGERV